MTDFEKRKMLAYWDISEEVALGYPRTMRTSSSWGAIVTADERGYNIYRPYKRVEVLDGVADVEICFCVMHADANGYIKRKETIPAWIGEERISKAIESKNANYYIIDDLEVSTK